MSVLTYIKYKTNVKSTSPRYGKYYGRVHHRETVDLDGLTKHIMDHGSIFTEDVVAGVLKKFKNCLIELLLDSKKVKIDGLGTFYLAVKSKAAESAEAFSASNIKSAHIRFLADQSAKTNLSGPQLFLFSAMGCPKSLVRVSGRWHPIAS